MYDYIFDIYIQPNGVAGSVQPEQITCSALYIFGKINPGQRVEVFTDSYPDRPLYGDVVHIADTAEFTPKNVQTKDERVRLIYKIKVEIPNPDGVLKIGMPVDVRFLEE